MRRDPIGTDATDEWVAALDALQAHLVTHRAARRAGEDPPAPLAVPDIATPMPAFLRPRAEMLLELVEREITSREPEKTVVRRSLTEAHQAHTATVAPPTPTVRAFDSLV